MENNYRRSHMKKESKRETFVRIAEARTCLLYTSRFWYRKKKNIFARSVEELFQFMIQSAVSASGKCD